MNPDGVSRHWKSIQQRGRPQHITLTAQAHRAETVHTVESGDMEFGGAMFRLQMSHDWWRHYGVQRYTAQGIMGTAGEWVLPAYDVFVLQWTILRKRVWRRKDGGKGRKCAQVWASMKGNERALFEEWARACGTKEEDMSTMELRCTITHSDGHTICSVYLHRCTIRHPYGVGCLRSCHKGGEGR